MNIAATRLEDLYAPNVLNDPSEHLATPDIPLLFFARCRYAFRERNRRAQIIADPARTRLSMGDPEMYGRLPYIMSGILPYVEVHFYGS
jgi:hypothetical protein